MDQYIYEVCAEYWKNINKDCDKRFIFVIGILNRSSYKKPKY